MHRSALAFALSPSSRLFPITRTRTASICTTQMSLISPKEAHARKSGTPAWIHVDVRTVEEFARIRAPDSLNIPFMNAGPAGMAPNPSFLSDVTGKLQKDKKLLVSCASGKRSAMAAGVLTKEGYTVADVEGGMMGWSDTEGLPTESGAGPS